MLSFAEYASEKQILELLIKERAKVAIKKKLQKVSPTGAMRKAKAGAKMSFEEQIFLLMPPRDQWARPRRRERLQHNDASSPKSTKQVLMRSIALTINKHRKGGTQYPYLQRLDIFIASLRADIVGSKPLRFTSIKVIGKKKKVNNDGTIVLRPLCTFNDLREKLLIALASKYLSEIFDPLLHEEVLSYRPLRRYHNGDEPVITDRNHAIENIQNYRRQFYREGIYVTECDIQKYFDTINHDVIRCCFADFASAIKQSNPEFDYSAVGRIVDAYLDSYSFYKNVAVENAHLSHCYPPRIYEGVKDILFIERGCYSEQEFALSKDKIGIPQGGALSGLISNVVLSTIDRNCFLSTPDCRMFFCRYGDDIILMHTSKQRCEELINNYCTELTKSKLLYHSFISVADPQFHRHDGGIRSLLWDQKSRSPFLWGRKEGDSNSMDWVGFLGYEVRYTGEVRMRRSSMNDKFKSLKRKYRNEAKSRFAKGTLPNCNAEVIDKCINKIIERFTGDGLAGAKRLTYNRYSLKQALKLNAYASRQLYRLFYKIYRNNHLSDSDIEQWWNRAKDSGCFNYIKTLPNNKRPNY